MSLTLYYAPGACSLADHIALKEAGLDHDLVKVDLGAHKTEDGRDYYEINPKGAVPAIDRDGEVLTENVALLIMIAETSGKLLPADGLMRYRVLESAVFITSEVHKSFAPLFQDGTDDAKAQAKEKLSKKFELLSGWLGDDGFIVGEAMSIADCYLIVMCLWATKMGIELKPNLLAYLTRMSSRDAVKAAMSAEGLR
ncbi:MAG: glutathione binding-like protein [Pacificimonas sp.]